MANALRSKNYKDHEKVFGLSETSRNRRIDIIAIESFHKQAYIIDPTIRFESYLNQSADVHTEKTKIYAPTINFYKTKFNVNSIDIIGLFLGSRGTLTKRYIEFWSKFQLPRSLDKILILKILRSSVSILRHHLYSSN